MARPNSSPDRVLGHAILPLACVLAWLLAVPAAAAAAPLAGPAPAAALAGPAPAAALAGPAPAAALAGPAPVAALASRSPGVRQSASATLEQCTPAALQSERSATFVGEMSAITGTARLQMRFEVLERTPAEASFHAVAYPGVGVWLKASAGVKSFKDLNRVTDLTAPAIYRALVHFRWMNARGHAIRTLELRTPECDQPAPPPPLVGSA